MSWILIVLSLVICLWVLILFYLDVLIPKQKGKTLLTVPLRSLHRIDGVIFICLLSVTLYYDKEGISGNKLFLLLGLIGLSIYFYFIRTPKLRIKESGFFYGLFFINYEAIVSMQLNEKGVLFFNLRHKTLDIHVAKLQDLERLYQVLAHLNYNSGATI